MYPDIDDAAIDRNARDLYSQFKILGSEWYENGIAACLRYDGRCAYCGLDLLTSHAICYHMWCLDHLLPQVAYPKLKERRENLVLACRRCNNIKGTFDPNREAPVYYGTDELTGAQAAELLTRAKKYVSEEVAHWDAAFKEQLHLLRPFIKRLSGDSVQG